MNNRLLAHLALFGANLIYGINYTVAKDVMPDFCATPRFYRHARMWCCHLVLVVLSLLFLRKSTSKGYGSIGTMRTVWRSHKSNVIFEGLNLTTPINAAVIMVINPILVLVFAGIISTERLTFRKWLGIGLGAAGAIMLITNGGKLSISQDHILGNTLVLINATSYAIYLVLVKSLMQKYQPITVISWVFLFGVLVVVPFGWNEFAAIEWTTMPNLIKWEIAFVIVGTPF